MAVELKLRGHRWTRFPRKKRNVLDVGKNTTNNDIVKTIMASSGSDCSEVGTVVPVGSREFFDVDLRQYTIFL